MNDQEERAALREDSDFRHKLEALGYGLCDVCLSIHSIGRGDNFFFQEETGAYSCVSCEPEELKDEITALLAGVC